jgi:hypothetical protein
MKPFLSFQGSRACFFSDLFTSRFKEAGLRIPLEKLGAAVSPIPKPEKNRALPPVTPETISWPCRSGEFHVKKRAAYYSGEGSKELTQ